MQLISFLEKLQTLNQRIQNEFLELYEKGETVDNIVKMVQFLESKKISIPAPKNKNIFDVCGTGGTKKQRINLSTALAIKLSENFCIAKHGNKSSSGRCGSFDVLENSEFPICTNPKQTTKELLDKNCAFVFGPAFHPIMGLVTPMRKSFSQPTIFNIIGPLLNPLSKLTAQMIGVKDIKTAEKLAKVCLKLKKNALLVHDTHFGLDEVSIGGATHYFKILKGNIETGTFFPEDFGVNRISNFSDIQGGKSISENQKIFHTLLNGTASIPQKLFLEINYKVAKNFFSQF